MRPHLNSRISALCNPFTPITTELFGEDIGKETDELTKTSRIGLKLSTPRKQRARFHPYGISFRGSKNPSTFNRRDDRTQNNRVLLCALYRRTRREVRRLAKKDRATMTTSYFHCNQVSYIDTTHLLHKKQSTFVGGQTRFHIQQWQKITSDPNVSPS